MNDGGPAKEMSLQDYACIKLKIPETGRPWFDDLIRKSLRNDLAAHAPEMPGWFAELSDAGSVDTYFEWRWYYAANMLKAREEE